MNHVSSNVSLAIIQGLVKVFFSLSLSLSLFFFFSNPQLFILSFFLVGGLCVDEFLNVDPLSLQIENNTLPNCTCDPTLCFGTRIVPGFCFFGIIFR